MGHRFGSASFLVVIALCLFALPPSARADPPGRVGRIGQVEGQAWWSQKYDAPAEDARRNWPVTSDNVIATGDGRAEIRIGSTSIALDRDSEIEFVRLDDERMRVRLLQGRLALRLLSRETAREVELSTPFGRVRTLEAGRYRIEVDRGGERGSLTVFEGHARYDGAGSGLEVRDGEALRITGDDGRATRLEGARRSQFDDWHLARNRHGEPAALRYVSADMTGYEDLDDYGDWGDYADYGAAWIPRGLPSGWAPYRHGRWAWVEPWGWTWIDDMPWGFAPFHYGRWALIRGDWAWVPGRIVARPVYSPALVVWIGSVATPSVGWFPLGPREVYVPGYTHSREHLQRINAAHVRRIDHADVTRIRYLHRDAPRAVTVVSAATVSAGRPVHREVVRVGERSELRGLTPIAVPRDLKPEPAERHRGSEAAERWRERHRVADRGREAGSAGRFGSDERERRGGETAPESRGRLDQPGGQRRSEPPGVPVDAATGERERSDVRRRSEEQRRRSRDLRRNAAKRRNDARPRSASAARKDSVRTKGDARTNASASTNGSAARSASGQRNGNGPRSANGRMSGSGQRNGSGWRPSGAPRTSAVRRTRCGAGRGSRRTRRRGRRRRRRRGPRCRSVASASVALRRKPNGGRRRNSGAQLPMNRNVAGCRRRGVARWSASTARRPSA